MKLSSIDDLLFTSWQNGAGRTREIARSEGDSGIVWRLSVAEIEAGAGFSSFPGLRRCLTVFRGAGLSLTLGSEVSSPGNDPFWFSGDAPVRCAVPSGTVSVFNLMHDPAVSKAAVKVLPEISRQRIMVPRDTVICVFCLSGRLRIGAATGEAGCYAVISGGDREVAFDVTGRVLCAHITVFSG